MIIFRLFIWLDGDTNVTIYLGECQQWWLPTILTKTITRLSKYPVCSKKKMHYSFTLTSYRQNLKVYSKNSTIFISSFNKINYEIILELWSSSQRNLWIMIFILFFADVLAFSVAQKYPDIMDNCCLNNFKNPHISVVSALYIF